MNAVLKLIFIKCFLIHRSRIHDLSGDTKHAILILLMEIRQDSYQNANSVFASERRVAIPRWSSLILRWLVSIYF